MNSAPLQPPLRLGVYPGSFDPVTHGHIDIITRSLRAAVDHVIVAVATVSEKKHLLSQKLRLSLLEDVIAATPELQTRVTVLPLEGLLMDFVRTHRAQVLIRGLRAVSDFDYEFQMAGMNRRLDETIETIFLMASERHHFVASSLVREVAALGGDIHSFVHPLVAQALQKQARN